MLRCFDHHRDDHWGKVVFDQAKDLRKIEDHVRSANKHLDKAEQAKARGKDKDYREQMAKADAEAAKARVKLAAQRESTSISSELAARLEAELANLKQRIDPMGTGSTPTPVPDTEPSSQESAPESVERQSEPTIDAFSSNYSRGFPEMTRMSTEENKRFREELGRVIAPLDQFNELLKAQPRVESQKLKKALDAFREERKKFNAAHDAKFAIPDITEAGDITGEDTKIKEDTKNVLNLLVAVRGGNAAYRSLNSEGVSNAEGEKRLKEDIASLKGLEERFLREFEVLKTLDSAYATNHEVQKVGPALQDLALALKVKVASVIGSVDNQKNAHPELFEHWKAQVREWENRANGAAPGDKSSKWSAQAAETYRDAIYTAYLGGKYELKRTAPGGAFTVLEEKSQTKPENSPKIEDIKTFLRNEGVLNDSNQGAFNANLKAMPFYAGRFTKPEERTAAEQQTITQQLEGAKLPTALRSQTQYALDHPAGAILGNPLLFITLLSLIIFDGKNRTKYLGGLAALLGVEAIGGFGALSDAAKSGYESWLKPLFEGTGAAGRGLMEKVFGKKTVENLEEGKMSALVEWMNYKKATEFADKSAKGLWEALKNDRDKLKQAGNPLGNKLKDISDVDIGKFVGLKWVSDWLNGNPADKPFAQHAAEVRQKEAQAAAEAARRPGQGQEGTGSMEKPKNSPSEIQGKLDVLTFEPQTNLKWAAASTIEGGEAVRMLKVTGSDAKDHNFEVRYDGTRYRVREVQVTPEGTKAALEFDIGFRGDTAKAGLPKVLERFDVGQHKWKGDAIFIGTFLKSSEAPGNLPEGTARVANQPPYYGNGRYGVVLQRGNEDVFVEVSVDEKTKDNAGNAYLLTQVTKDGSGNFVATATQKEVKEMNQKDAGDFVKGLGKIDVAQQTPASRFFGPVLGDKQPTYSEGGGWIHAAFTHEGQPYNAFREEKASGEGFWVEAVDAEGKKVENGYALRFDNAAMFRENFPDSVKIAENDGGYTLGTLLGSLESIPHTKATLNLNGDKTGAVSTELYYDVEIETAKGKFKLNAPAGSKDGFQIYNEKQEGVEGGNKFISGKEAAKAMGLETAPNPAEKPMEKVKTIDEVKAKLAALALPANAKEVPNAWKEEGSYMNRIFEATIDTGLGGTATKYFKIYSSTTNGDLGIAEIGSVVATTEAEGGFSKVYPESAYDASVVQREILAHYYKKKESYSLGDLTSSDNYTNDFEATSDQIATMDPTEYIGYTNQGYDYFAVNWGTSGNCILRLKMDPASDGNVAVKTNILSKEYRAAIPDGQFQDIEIQGSSGSFWFDEDLTSKDIATRFPTLWKKLKTLSDAAKK